MKQERQLSQSMCKRTFMEAEQLFSATPYLMPARRKQDNSELFNLSSDGVHLYLLINTIRSTEKKYTVYLKNWVVFNYQHKVVINHSCPERTSMKFFVLFLWGKVKVCVPKPIITSKCSAYQHTLFQLRSNIKLHLWPVVTNLSTFTQNNVWLPYTPAYTKYSFKCIKNLNSMIQILLL